jgi:glycosyltransferase involved in cell wall biosynthesis
MACKNEARHLSTMLTSLTRQSWEGNWEVIIADNGSTDDTRSIAESFSTRLPGLMVVDASARRGAAYARNRGVEHSSGGKLLFLDGDDEVGDGYVAAMANALDTHVLVSAQLELERLNPPWSLKVELDRTRGGQQGALPAEFGFLPYAGGGAMGIRRTVFDEVGGFRLQPTFEEADLCWRVQLAGYPPPVFADGATLHYRLPDSLRSEYRRGRDYVRGQLALYELYRGRGMRSPHRVTLRHLAGALRRVGTMEGAALTAATLGRLIGQLTDFPMI